MSLINQMLQDLEHRSVGNPVPGGIHGQIRAVPDRRRIHPAWWLVLLLTLFLVGAVVWYLTRPAPAPQPAPNLALKIAPQLGALPSPAAQEPLPLDTAPPPPPVVRPAAAVAEVPAQRVEPARATAKQIEAPKPQEPAKARPAEEPAASVTDDAKSKGINKKIAEFTTQQRAENQYREAGALIQSGKLSEATALLEQTIKLDPRHTGVRQTLVGLLLQAKRNDEAV